MIGGLGVGLLLSSSDADASVRAGSVRGDDGNETRRNPGAGSALNSDDETAASSSSSAIGGGESAAYEAGESVSDVDSSAPVALGLSSDDGADANDAGQVTNAAIANSDDTTSSNSRGVSAASPTGATASAPTSSTVQNESSGSSQPATTSTTSPAVSPATTSTTAAPASSTGEWCRVEVRESDSILRWDDGGKTAVFRLNNAWFNTPGDNATELVINNVADANDSYVMRLWGGGGSTDVACTFGNGTSSTATTLPSGHVQMGFAVDLWGTDREQYWANLEAVPGAGTLIAHEFKSFTKEIRTDIYRWHMESGRDLLLTWNGTDAESILNGSHDEWIREHARELKSLPDTVMLRFWHEPDVQHKRTWIDDDPQQFIDSWNYVRAIFAEEQANNIEWVWCPTAWNWDQQGARYYPGDAAVDWICADGYSGWDLDAPLTDISDAYTAFQAWADQRPHMPILIAEFGAGQRGPGDRAEWVQGIDDWVSASEQIRAVVYFDIDRRPNGEIYNWQLRTESDAWAAMMDVITSAPFGQ